MTFRDDRDALKQKTEGLERDLKAAQAELDVHRNEADRAKKLEAELAAAREMLGRIEAQMIPPRPAANRPTQMILVGCGLLGAVALAGGVAAAVLVRSAPAPEAVLVTPPPTPVVAQPPAVPTPPPTLPAEPAEPLKTVRARWPGKVKTATGLPLAPGTPCAVEAVLRSDKQHELTLACGDEVLYRSTDALEGMSQSSAGAGEQPAAAPGTAEAAIVWDDVGARTGPRTQASIRSQERIAAAWRDTSPRFRVEVEIPEFSEPYSGTFEAGHDDAALPFTARVVAKARIVDVQGAATVSRGTTCDVSLVPQWGSEPNCRVRLTCAGKVLYGAGTTGFAQCEVADGAPRAFHDAVQDGDPILHWDVPAKKMDLAVKEGAGEWTAKLEVDPT